MQAALSAVIDIGIDTIWHCGYSLEQEGGCQDGNPREGIEQVDDKTG